MSKPNNDLLNTIQNVIGETNAYQDALRKLDECIEAVLISIKNKKEVVEEGKTSNMLIIFLLQLLFTIHIQ